MNLLDLSYFQVNSQYRFYYYAASDDNWHVLSSHGFNLGCNLSRIPSSGTFRAFRHSFLLLDPIRPIGHFQDGLR